MKQIPFKPYMKKTFKEARIVLILSILVLFVTMAYSTYASSPKYLTLTLIDNQTNSSIINFDGWTTYTHDFGLTTNTSFNTSTGSAVITFSGAIPTPQILFIEGYGYYNRIINGTSLYNLSNTNNYATYYLDETPPTYTYINNYEKITNNNLSGVTNSLNYSYSYLTTNSYSKSNGIIIDSSTQNHTFTTTADFLFSSGNVDNKYVVNITNEFKIGTPPPTITGHAKFYYADGTNNISSNIVFTGTGSFVTYSFTNPNPERLVTSIETYYSSSDIGYGGQSKNLIVQDYYNKYNTFNTTNTQTSLYQIQSTKATYYTLYSNSTILNSATNNVYGLYNSILNITLKNINDNTSVNTFNGWISNNAYGYNETFTTTNGIASINLINGLTYTIYVDAATISTTPTTSITVSSSTQNFNINVYPINSLIISAKDLNLNTPLTSTTVTLQGSVIYTINVNDTATNYSLTPGTYNLIATQTNYNTYHSTLTIGKTLANTTIYLGNGTQATNIYVKNSYSQFLQGATVQLIRQMDGAILETKTTDGSGGVQIYPSTNQAYYLNITATGYNPYYQTFTAIDNTYTVTLSQTNASYNIVNFYDGITSNFLPDPNTALANNTNVNFQIFYTSDLRQITNCYISIVNNTALLVALTPFSNCGSSNGFTNLTYNTGQQKLLTVIMTLTVYNGTSYSNISYKTPYGIYFFYQGDYSLAHAFNDVSKFNKSGMDDFTKSLIFFIVIFIVIIGVARQNINQFIQTDRIMILLTALIGLGCVLGFLNLTYLPVGGQFGSVLSQYGLLIISFIFTVYNMYANWNEGGGEN